MIKHLLGIVLTIALLLRDVLAVKLDQFSIAPGTTRLTLRQSLSATPEVKAILTQHDVVPDNQTFMSRDLMPLGREYHFRGYRMSVSALLNHLIRESQTKYWIMLRNGERKQYFVLNL